jgi:hypothetical protein
LNKIPDTVKTESITRSDPPAMFGLLFGYQIPDIKCSFKKIGFRIKG